MDRADLEQIRSPRTNSRNGLSATPDYENAKSYLLTSSTVTGLNLYDHLGIVLAKILNEQPKNVVDIFEDYSKAAKQAKPETPAVSVLEGVEAKTRLALAKVHEKLISKGDGEDDAEFEDEYPIQNVMEVAHFFEQACAGLNREEMFRIGMALKILTETHPLEHARFWGKILGLDDNYIIAEVEYREGDEEDDEDDISEEAADELEKTDGEDNDEEQEDDTPKVAYKPPPVVPREEIRTGANKKTYFVCNEPGKPWIKLPYVTPQQIVAARKIRKFFTGRLDAPINSYPPFPGNEANYLRAQIARISAGTHISPLGFYQFDEDDVDEDEGALPDNFVINTEFEPLSPRELASSMLSNWVHHVQHILPQGRCSWWNPKQADEEEAEVDSDAEDENPDEPQPEVGPPLLTPLSEDAPISGMSAWSTQVSTKLLPQFAVAVVRSNLWPGAHAFAFGKTFENVYIGWGHKYSADSFSPTIPPEVQLEYPLGLEITEVDDPTPEEEAALLETQEEEQEDQDDDGNYDDEEDD